MTLTNTIEDIPIADTVEFPPATKIFRMHIDSPAGDCRIGLRQLHARHRHALWDAGTFHAYCVERFIEECDAILAGRPVAGFSQVDLDHLIATLRGRGNSNATINRKLSAVGKLLKKGASMGEVHALPEFRRLKGRAGRLRFLEFEEEDRLFSAIRLRSEDYFRLSVFLVDSGARLGEAIGLRWNDINDGRATFWLTKSNRSRTIPLTARARAAVEAAGHKRGPGPFAGIRQHRYRAVWNEAKDAVGLADDADVVPHILRHTCASRLVRGGVDIRRVQTWLGHQSLQMTMRYAHLATSDLDACLPALERP